MSDQNYGHVDQWISEYPSLKRHIMRNKRLFSGLDVPRGREVTDQEWMEIVQRIQSVE